MNRLATPLPDSVLDRYFLDPKPAERLARDTRRHVAEPTLPLEWGDEYSSRDVGCGHVSGTLAD